MCHLSTKVSILFLVALSSILLSCGEEDSEQPPNIIFILADDLGWADLPSYGNTFNEAPSLDRMAREGMRFVNAYAACPVCSPTRASIQSGQYPARVGIIDFLPGHWRPFEEVTVPQNRTQYLPLQIETVGEVMKSAGYSTGYFGKWHLGHTEKHFPKNQGYDESVIFQGSPYYNYNNVLKPPQEFPEEKILSEALTDLSIDFIEKHQDSSFFLTLAFYDVHVQLDADTQLIEKYLAKPNNGNYPGNAIYAAMIEHIDISVGRVLDKLNELGLSQETMVVFFSDNGGLISRFDKVPLIAESKQHYYEGDSLLYIASSNAPLRSEKGTVYEGGIREPMLVYWPGRVPAGSTNEALISSVDFLPTFKELSGYSREVGQTLDGASFTGLLDGKTQQEERAIFWHYPVYHHAVPASAVRKGKWKLIHYLNDDTVDLYDLESDPGETRDLTNTNPDKARELKGLLADWRSSVNAELPVPNPDFDPERRQEWGSHPGREALFSGGQ